MATAKTAVKKSAAKKTPAKPRADYAAGTRVKVTLRTGATDTARVTGIKSTPTGSFIQMTLKDGTAYEARPKMVRGY